MNTIYDNQRGLKRPNDNNNNNEDDVGVVYYRSSAGLRSPPGYSPKRANRRRPTEKDKITLREGSLFNMCLKFMSLNIDLLDSLHGLPDMIGEQVFAACVRYEALVFLLDADGGLTTSDRIKVRVLGLFDEAYNEMLLSRMSLRGVPLAIDVAPIIAPFRNIVDLDVSDRLVSDGVLCAISKFHCLERLVMQNTGLSDSCVVKMIRPYRVFSDNPQELEHLDIAGNPGVANQSLEGVLTVFKQLKWFDVSGCGVTMHQSTTYELRQFGWKRAHNTQSFEPIDNKGWAAPIFTHLKNWRKLDGAAKKCPKAVKFYSSKKARVEVVAAKKVEQLQLLRDDTVSVTLLKMSKEALLGEKKLNIAPKTKSKTKSSFLDDEEIGVNISMGGPKKIAKMPRRLKIKSRGSMASSSNSLLDADEENNDNIKMQYSFEKPVSPKKSLFECLEK